MPIRTGVSAAILSLILAACGPAATTAAPEASDQVSSSGPEAAADSLQDDGHWSDRNPEPWVDRAAGGTPPALSFRSKTAEAEVELKLAREIARWPALHAGLYDREVRLMGRFERMVGEAKRQHRAAGAASDYVFVRQVRWSVAAATPRLVSLKGDWYEDIDAAHPYAGFDVLLWDAAQLKPIPASDLFLAGDDAAIDTALCDALAKQKAAKNTRNWDRSQCPTWRKAELALAPSTAPGKVGGVTLLFEPYAAGSYAEGDYGITLPWDLFKGVIAPTYAGEFGGRPKPGPAPKD